MWQVGLLVAIVLSLGVVGNYGEWGVHDCFNPDPYPVCGSIFWLIMEFVAVILAGIALVVAGFRVATKELSKPSPPLPLLWTGQVALTVLK